MAATLPSSPITDQLSGWVAALDAVLDELRDDLVRRAIVHLSALRDELLAAGSTAADD